MSTLIPFAVCLILITVAAVRYRLPPFLTLIGASILFGVLSGMPAETLMPAITGGAGRIFSILGIVIFCGVVIAQVLRESGQIESIVADIKGAVQRPLYTSGVAGFLLSVPLMCGITAFVIISPIVAHLRSDRAAAVKLLYVAAVGAILSYVLLYPSPVIQAMVTLLPLTAADPWQLNLVTLPVALMLLLLLFAVWRYRLPIRPDETAETGAHAPTHIHIRAWLPFLALAAMILTGVAVPALSLLGNINIALFAAVLIALAGVPGDVQQRALMKGTKNAGIIIFDLCGAGAFGGVIAASAFPAEVTTLVSGLLPAVLLPFVIAALVQAAQGSRVVTAAITSTILAATGIVADFDPTTLVLMIAAGAFMFSYVSDPFFWLVKRATDDSFFDVIKNYTLPLSCAGIITLAAALIIEARAI
jgi:gluconate:H+ symporter, GntP family